MTKVKRRLAAILAADVAGYSRLMGDDERATLETLDAYRAVFLDLIARNEGRVVDTAGDSVLAVFDSVVEAAVSAIAIQNELLDRNAALPPHRQMHFRVGVHLGDVIAKDDGTIYGDGVNVAARLESLARRGGLALSEDAYRQVRGRVEMAFEDAGTFEVKNIAEPVHVFAWGGHAESPKPSVRSGSKPTLALGSFEAAGPGDDAAVLAGGVRDALASVLSRQSGLVVLPDIDQADYAVTGKVQVRGDRYRSSIRIFDRAAGRQLASDRFDGDIADMFDAEDDLAQRAYSSIRFTIYDNEAAKTSELPDSEQTTEGLLARASKQLLGDDRGEFAACRRILAIVLERAPDNFMALSMQAVAHTGEVVYGYRGIGREDGEIALELTQRAVRLNERSDFGQIILAWVHLFVKHDFDAARRALDRSLELNPYYPVARQFKGSLLVRAGQPREGVDHLIKVFASDSRGLLNHRVAGSIGLGQYLLGHDADAAEWLERSDRLWPDVLPTLLTMAAVRGRSGDDTGRRQIVDRLMTLEPALCLADIAPWPFRDGADWDRFQSDLRQAGLP